MEDHCGRERRPLQDDIFSPLYGISRAIRGQYLSGDALDDGDIDLCWMHTRQSLSGGFTSLSKFFSVELKSSHLSRKVLRSLFKIRWEDKHWRAEAPDGYNYDDHHIIPIPMSKTKMLLLVTVLVFQFAFGEAPGVSRRLK